ncbi:MAG TPA: hypothetical protein VIJ60_07870 [Acidimicrobiales bacterium]
MLVACALVLSIAAAARSTWSPCGVSMLSTLTPLGERGRGTRFATTAAWFVAGSVVGGALLGAAGAVVALVVSAAHVGATTADAAAAAAAALAAAADVLIAGRRAVGHHRQVNERWLDQFRPWVYGAGFGAQIGCGVATYVRTAGVYLVVALGGLSGRPLFALGLGLLFGAVRGTAVLLGRRLDTPEALRRFHARFSSLGPSSRRTMIAVELASAVLLVAAAVSGRPAIVAPLAVLVGLVLLATLTVLATPATRREARAAGFWRQRPTGSAAGSRAGLAEPGEAPPGGALPRPSAARPRP